jgi:hypothetical protein
VSRYTRTPRSIRLSSVVLILVFGTIPAQTLGSTATSADSLDMLDQIIVTGTRQSGTKAADSAGEQA